MVSLATDSHMEQSDMILVVSIFESKPDGTMALVGTERGRETLRQETKSVEELMYWIFKSRANSIAFFTPHPGLDHTAKQQIALDKMAKVSPEWRDRLKREQDARHRE